MKNLIILLSGIIIFSLANCTKDAANSSANGQAGSLAQMITVGNYLYVINQSELLIYSVQDPLHPVYQNVIEVGFGIETIYPFGENLFIGSTTGLYIYDITDPIHPFLATESPLEHFTACDPVVANENYAYVTLNSLRQECGSNINLLITYDITDIANSSEVSSYSMAGPKGLALSETRLFVSDSSEGIVIFDISETPASPQELETISGFTANDLIIENSILMAVCDDGLRQFDISNLENITQISFLSTNE